MSRLDLDLDSSREHISRFVEKYLRRANGSTIKQAPYQEHQKQDSTPNRREARESFID